MKKAAWEKKEQELNEWVEQQAAEMAKLSPKEQAEEMLFRQKMSMRLPPFVMEILDDNEELEDQTDALLFFLASLAVKHPAAKDEIMKCLTEHGAEHFYATMNNPAKIN